MSQKKVQFSISVVKYIIVVILVFISLFPLVWAIAGSFKSNAELFLHPYELLPNDFTFANYSQLFMISNFLNCVKNSAVTSIVSTILSLIIACLAGYSLTRFKFPGSKVLERLLMDSYMIPAILLVLPVYTIINKAGMRDSLWAYGFMIMSHTLPFCLWLVKSYYAGVSVEFEEAAMVDGATRFQAFLKVVTPQLTPAIVAVGIQAFIMVWNDLLFSKILLSSERSRTLPLVISSMFAQDQAYPWGVILAGTVIATLPVLIMFIFGVEKLIGGWSEGGVKG